MKKGERKRNVDEGNIEHRREVEKSDKKTEKVRETKEKEGRERELDE